MTGRRIAALAATLLLPLGLAGCDSDLEPGPAGTVVGKGSRRSCDWEYELTTSAVGREDAEFEVPASVYDDCVRGARYPKCTEGDR